MTATSGLAGQLHRFVLLHEDCGFSDRQLLECFLARRDEGSFAALVHRHGPMVLRVCRRMLKNNHDADDAFQATFLVLVRRAASIRRPEALGSWLYGVACRTALEVRAMTARQRRLENGLKRRFPRGAWEPGFGSACVVGAEPGANDSDPNDWRPVLDDELSRLPDKYRTAIVLCDLQGLTRRQAAQKLQLPEGTVSGRLTTARRLLARRLKRRGVTLSAGALAVLLAQNTALASSALASATIKAIQPAAASRVLAVTEGVMKAMLYDKLKRLACVVLLMAAVGLGIGRIDRSPAAAADFALQKTEVPKANAAEGKKAVLQKDNEKFFKIEGARWAVWSADRKVMAVWFGRTEKRPDTEDVFDYYTTIKIYDAVTGAEKVTLGEAKNIGAQYMALSPDGSVLALSTRLSIQKGDNIEIWDTKTGQPRDPIKLEYGRARLAMAFSPDGRALAVTYGGPPTNLSGGMRLVDLKSGKLLAMSIGHKHLTVSVAFSPDGKLLATGGDNHDGQIRIWDGKNGKELRAIHGGKGPFLGLAFSPDGKYVAAADTEGGVRLFEVATGVESSRLKDSPSSAKEVAFSPDGRLIACARAVEKDKKQSGEVLLWNLDSGELLLTVEGTASNTVSFSADGRTLAVLTSDGIKLLDIGKYGKKK